MQPEIDHLDNETKFCLGVKNKPAVDCCQIHNVICYMGPIVG